MLLISLSSRLKDSFNGNYRLHVLFIYLIRFQTIGGFNERFRRRPVSFRSNDPRYTKKKAKTTHQASGLERDSAADTSSATKVCVTLSFLMLLSHFQTVNRNA